MGRSGALDGGGAGGGPPAPPPPRRGEAVFQAIGCASCHRPSFQIPRGAAHPALAGVIIRPYTDLLLHNMGPGLADAGGAEWRTPPLWGAGLTELVGGGAAHYLHDGRARSLQEAVLWHGGEAARSREAFSALGPLDRQALIAFVRSL